MKQLLPGEEFAVAHVFDAAVMEKISTTREAISARSLLSWGEHCTECAMPGCYASCAFYSPRADLKCRRFHNGVASSTVGANPSLHGISVRFRKWGKLEAIGDARPMAPARVKAAEIADAIVAKTLGGVPALRFIPYKLAGRWNNAKGDLFAAGASKSHADAFVLECILTGETPAILTFSIKPKTSGQYYFQRHIELKPGYNKTEIDLADIASLIDLTQTNLFQIEPVGAWGHRDLIITLADFVTYRHQSHQPRSAAKATSAKTNPEFTPASTNKKCKCIVWDLDNTLWRGILIEDGVENLAINREAVATIKELDRRGILHSIASKNNRDDALAALENFGLREYFLSPQISWAPKSQSIKAIAENLNLSVDSFAFVDDQAFERGEVRAVHPKVSIYADHEINRLLTSSEFDVPATPEAAQRRQMYREEELRQTDLKDSGEEFLTFLKTCQMLLTITTIAPENIDRIFELAQRTNQLNYAGKRLAMTEIKALLDGAPLTGFVLDCSDRYGDYGMIGFAVVDIETFTVENFFMSCRVQGKKVDNAFFNWLKTRANLNGVENLNVRFIATAKNTPARRALADMQFTAATGGGYFSRPTRAALPNSDIVAIRDLTRNPLTKADNDAW